MDKKKTELLVIAAGLVVLIVLLMNNLKVILPKKMPASNPSQAGDLRGRKTGTLFTVPVEVKKEFKELGWGRDPFVLQESTAPERVSLKLMGITAGDDKRKAMAVINDDIVTVGSKVGNYKVVQINKHEVVLNDGTKDTVLKME